MRFRQAVKKTKGLEHAYRPGLQALRRGDHSRVSSRNPRIITGSVDLDNVLATTLPNDPRWDYGVGVVSQARSETVIWIEIHPASSHHIDDVLRKLDWLKNWLWTRAPQLDEMTREFVWVASGQVDLPPGSQQRRKLADKRLRFEGRRLQIS